MLARLRAIFGERTLVFLLSLAIATALWFFVRDTARSVTLPGRAGQAVKTVPVVPRITGAPAEGFAVRGLEVRPPAVTLSGPVGIVDQIDVVPTEAVDVGGATQDVEREAELRVPPAVLAQGTVTVLVRIGPVVARRRIPSVPVVVEGVPAGMEAAVRPSSVAVEVEGLPDAVAALVPSEVRVAVEVADLPEGTHQVVPRVTVPGPVRIVMVTPARVSVVVRRV